MTSALGRMWLTARTYLPLSPSLPLWSSLCYRSDIFSISWSGLMSCDEYNASTYSPLIRLIYAKRFVLATILCLLYKHCSPLFSYLLDISLRRNALAFIDSLHVARRSLVRIVTVAIHNAYSSSLPVFVLCVMDLCLCWIGDRPDRSRLATLSTAQRSPVAKWLGLNWSQ